MMFTAFHIVTGIIGLASGAVAFYATKGAKLHKKSGLIFVYSMLLMSGSGALIAAVKSEPLNVIAGGLTFYLVATAFLTVRRKDSKSIWFTSAAVLTALVVGVGGVLTGLDGLKAPDGKIDGQPAQVAIVFGTIALLAASLDLKMVYSGGVRGKHRLVRHLWRMGFGLFLAAASFFLGQAQVIPEPIRKPVVLITPVLLVFLLTVFWVVRVLFFNYRVAVNTDRK